MCGFLPILLHVTFLAQSAVKIIRENTADVNVWNFTPSFSMLKKTLQRVLRWGAPDAEVKSLLLETQSYPGHLALNMQYTEIQLW